MKNHKNTIKQVLFFIFIIAFIYFVTSIDEETLTNISEKLGWFGIVFIGLFGITTQVFAPLSGSAMFFAGIRIYGYLEMVIVFYISSMVSSAICFYIARRWGRKVVFRFVGEDTMNKIDEITTVHEKTLLIIGRTLGYYFFDFISYALGLTRISFRKYITYTAILTIIPAFILYFIFKDLDFGNFTGSMIFYSSVALTGLIFAYLFRRIIKKHSKEKLQNL